MFNEPHHFIYRIERNYSTALYGPLPLCQFPNPTQSVGLLGRGISTSQGRYLHTEQHKHWINAHNADIHVLSGVEPMIPVFKRVKTMRPLWSATLLLHRPTYTTWAFCLQTQSELRPVTVAERSKAWTVFARSKPGSWARIPHKARMFGVCVCVCLFCV
jgi:hypothetical protein